MAAWFIRRDEPPASTWDVISWWEARRIPFNVVIGVYGLLCLVVFFWAILGSGKLAPGEDAVEPIALLAAPFAINMLYTLGWGVEVPARFFVRDLSPSFGPQLLKLGLGLGLFLSTAPAAFWVAYRVLLATGLAR